MKRGNEEVGFKVKGEVKDIIRYSDGRKEVREGENTVTVGMGTLIAMLFKNPSSTSGIGYWAIGSGESTWNDDSPAEPDLLDTSLVTEFARKVITESDMEFIDELGNVSEVPTNRLQINLMFLENEANGKWREFGIYGGDATDTLGSGLMLNHKTHPLIIKTNEMTIERQMKFTFIKTV